MAIFIKPDGLKYTTMAMYIDANVYRTDLTHEENNLIFEYIYHIVKMLAFKQKFFEHNKYYEDFAMYAATSIYFRLKNPKQYELNSDGTYKLQKVKSVLNYAKSVLYPRKITFEQEFYSQVYSYNKNDEISDFISDYTFSNQLSESIYRLNTVEFETYLSDINRTIKEYLKNIPYKPNTVLWNNIYVSCLLSYLNVINENINEIKRMNKFKHKFDYQNNIINKLSGNYDSGCVILYHLNESFHDYILLLIREINGIITNELSYLLHSNSQYINSLDAIAISEINSEYQDGVDV